MQDQIFKNVRTPLRGLRALRRIAKVRGLTVGKTVAALAEEELKRITPEPPKP
jgi:hypothetical protein